jgi:ATP-dependent DNA ligase
MPLAVRPPIAPMLARLTRELPLGDLTYEPKWDGFRCLAFVDDAEVDLRSRHDRPLARYFPELVAAFSLLREAAGTTFVLDGEIVLATSSRPGSESAGRNFADLMSRLHPAATRVERLARETPARYVAFDVLAIGGEDLRRCGYADRRERLVELVSRTGDAAAHPGASRADPVDRIDVSPATRDPAVARDWFEASCAGIDGVVAKSDDLRYVPGRRSMIKVKLDRTADCVLAGWRPLPGGAVSSLLLGLYDDAAALRHVGVVTQLPAGDRLSIARDLEPLQIPPDKHPWRNGFLIGQSPLGRLKGSAARWTPDMEHDWVPIRPERVLEVGFDQVDGDRFRHPARFRRWRPDRDAASCSLEQITGHTAVVATER